jgi:uroporphyrinogen decarboxylase
MACEETLPARCPRSPMRASGRNMEPQRLEDEFGDRLTFWGGVNTQTVLPFATPEEVRAETRRIIEVLGRGGGYVLNSVHAVQAEMPPANVVAMFDTAAAHAYAGAPAGGATA